MTGIDISVLYAALALLAFAGLKNRLARFVQPMRLQCAVVGEQALANEKITRDARDRLSSMMNSAYNGWVPIALAILVIPASILALYQRARHVRTDFDLLENAQLRNDCMTVSRKLLFAHVLSSPIFGTLFIIQIVAIFLIVAIAGGTFGAASRLVDAVAMDLGWIDSIHLHRHA